MENEKKYPIYYMDLKNEKFGLSDIALVDSPAYESLFLKFNKESEVKFAIQNEEEKVIMGAVMIPEKMVYREKDGKPFYVVATAETIYNASLKFMRENKNNNIKLTHQTDTTTPDVFIFESFVTNENRVSSVKGFNDLPIGTWFITCKVLNDAIWEDIKANKFNGFSLEALFNLKEIANLNEADINQILEALK